MKLLTPSIKKIWLMFAVFTALFILNFYVDIAMPATARMWLILDCWAIIISVLLLLQYKGVTIKAVLYSSAIAALASAGSWVIARNIVSAAMGFVVTFLATLSMICVVNKYPECGIYFIKPKNAKGLVAGLALGILVGILLGSVNYFLGVQQAAANFKLSFAAAVGALNPAIMEEIAFRTIFLLYVVCAVQGRKNTKAGTFTLWFMITMPHVIVHTPDIFLKQGVASGGMTILFLFILFGFPFAVLQKKKDVFSAITAHWVVDFIRFSFFGLP